MFQNQEKPCPKKFLRKWTLAAKKSVMLQLMSNFKRNCINYFGKSEITIHRTLCYVHL